MPFTSKRQQRAAFAGAIPGISKKKARSWAHETPDIKKLPDRAPAEKGKPTLRSKSAAQQEVDPRIRHFAKLAQIMGMTGSPASMGNLSGVHSAFDETPSNQPARGSGDFTPPQPKKPGLSVRKQATNPRLCLLDAMNKGMA